MALYRYWGEVGHEEFCEKTTARLGRYYGIYNNWKSTL